MNVVVLEDERSTTPTRRNIPLLPRENRVLGGRYRVRRLLGRGGMADVFLGDDLLLERTVAIKILHTHLADSGLERFRREAMILAAVRSPHVVGIYDIGLDDDVFLVMQHVEGHTIEAEIARTGPMSEVRVASVLTQLLSGLSEVHSLGLVHRDIKPSNVIVDHNDHVVLLDLGIALDARRSPLTAPGMVAGTPGYLAPESRTSAVSDYASDIYQVGLFILFLMTGVDLAHRYPLQGVEDLVEQLPPLFVGLTRRALSIDPADRFPSASVMRDALQVGASPVKRERARAPRSEQQPLLDLPTPILATPTQLIQRAPTRRIRTTVLQASQVLSLIQAAEIDFDLRPTRNQVALAKPVETPALPVRGKILILDNDPQFCRTLQRMLRAHDALIVSTQTQALAHLAGGSRVDVILCGLAAPMKFHAAILESRFAPSMIFLTSRDSSREDRAFVGSLAHRTLAKPFELALLEELIAECLAAVGR